MKFASDGEFSIKTTTWSIIFKLPLILNQNFEAILAVKSNLTNQNVCMDLLERI